MSDARSCGAPLLQVAEAISPNLLIKQGAKLVTSVEDVIEGFPMPVRAALTTEQGVDFLATASERRTHRPEFSDVLATLFDLEMKGFVRQLPGKQFSKILL